MTWSVGMVKQALLGSLMQNDYEESSPWQRCA
jgi:hypothetical protein